MSIFGFIKDLSIFMRIDMKISIVMLTFNSEKYLKKALKSIEFADEVVIIDNGSTDKTKQISSEFKNTKFIFQKWLGFGKQKSFGVNQAKNEWVFVLDSDEIFTKELESEIKDVLQNPKYFAYKVARLNYFFGKPIKQMGLYPDHSVRFFNKNHANFNDKEVHESVVLFDDANKFGVLKNHFLHYAYESIEQFINKQNRYSTLGAKKNRLKAIINPTWTFFKLFVVKGGFMAGWRGYVVAKLYSQYTFWKYIK